MGFEFHFLDYFSNEWMLLDATITGGKSGWWGIWLFKVGSSDFEQQSTAQLKKIVTTKSQQSWL